MLLRPLHHLRRNVIAYLALFVALGGTGYAASSLPAQSATAAPLPTHPNSMVERDPSISNGNIRAWAIIGPKGKVLAGGGGPRAHEGPITADYEIVWRVKLPSRCATTVTIDLRYSQPDETVPGLGNIAAGYAIANSGRSRNASSTGVMTFNPSGQPTPLAFDAVVIC